MYHAQAPGARLQQQPRRFSDRQQQQSSGSREFQPRQSKSGDGPSGQMGEGSYEGTRKYQDNIKSYLKRRRRQVRCRSRQARIRAAGGRVEEGRGRRPLAHQGARPIRAVRLQDFWVFSVLKSCS
jgi:hypothetical protein